MYYPKSFFKLLLIGFLLVGLPLAYAVGELYLRMEQLTRQSQQAVGLSFFGDEHWSDYTLTLKARKLSGAMS